MKESARTIGELTEWVLDESVRQHFEPIDGLTLEGVRRLLPVELRAIDPVEQAVARLFTPDSEGDAALYGADLAGRIGSALRQWRSLIGQVKAFVPKEHPTRTFILGMEVLQGQWERRGRYAPKGYRSFPTAELLELYDGGFTGPVQAANMHTDQIVENGRIVCAESTRGVAICRGFDPSFGYRGPFVHLADAHHPKYRNHLTENPEWWFKV